MAGVRDGVDLVGTGSVNTRLISQPAITVIGLDAPSVDGAVNAVVPHARATVSLRIPPGSDAATEMAVLVQHLQDAAPWGVDVNIVDAGTGEPFSTRSDGPALQHALAAMTQAYGVAASDVRLRRVHSVAQHPSDSCRLTVNLSSGVLRMPSRRTFTRRTRVSTSGTRTRGPGAGPVSGSAGN